MALPFQSFPSPVAPRSGGCEYVVSEIMFQKYSYMIPDQGEWIKFMNITIAYEKLKLSSRFR